MSSEHHLAHETEHEGLEHAHPTPKTYALIGLVLAIITMAATPMASCVQR